MGKLRVTGAEEKLSQLYRSTLTATESRLRAGKVPLPASVQQGYHKLTKQVQPWWARDIGRNEIKPARVVA